MTVARPVMAANVIAIPFITSDNFIFSEPLSSNALTVEEFNSASTASRSAETLDISFPAFSGDTALGPSLFSDGVLSNGATAGSLRSTNVLPFGPVDLAFPSISQRADESLAYERTYFFTDTFT